MTKNQKDTRKKIIETTIQLIKEEKDIDKITIRQITEKAGVATSMINYHFQTKKNLIDQAVQTHISKVISWADSSFDHLDLNPVEELRGGVKQAAGFMAENPGVARVSVLNDLKNGSKTDNSSQSLESLTTQLKEVFGEEKDEQQLKLIALQIVATMQVIFLRAPIIKKQFGLDYYNNLQRNKLMDLIIDNILYEGNKI